MKIAVAKGKTAIKPVTRNVRVVNRTKGTVLADEAAVARSFLSRGWGLLGHKRLDSGQGLILTKTNSIHSIGMRFAFDAVYVDQRGDTCRLLPGFRPFRFGPLVWRATDVIELPAGTIARTGTSLGDRIEIEPY